MEQHFASLSKRQTMLLLTAVTFGGPEGMEALAHLPEQEGELLKHRAEEILQIPRERRIPLLVQEIKRLLTSRRKLLPGADAEQLAELLLEERPVLREVVLRALPAPLAAAVRERLPKGQPVLKREVRPEVLNIVRWRLEERLSSQMPTQGVFKFADVLILQSRELLTLCDRMGARALATSFGGLPDADVEALFAKLPPDARALAQRVLEAGKARKLSEEDARAVLELHGAFANPAEAMRSAGVQRLVRACLAQAPDFAMRVLDRHGGEFGRLFARWLKDERKRALPRGDGGRADFVEQMERLAKKGVIERPIRLMPPKRPLGGEAVVAPPPPPRFAAAAAPKRDPIASREARRAAVEHRPDPVAQRNARRAGLGGNVLPSLPRPLEGPPARLGPPADATVDESAEITDGAGSLPTAPEPPEQQAIPKPPRRGDDESR